MISKIIKGLIFIGLAYSAILISSSYYLGGVIDENQNFWFGMALVVAMWAVWGWLEWEYKRWRKG